MRCQLRGRACVVACKQRNRAQRKAGIVCQDPALARHGWPGMAGAGQAARREAGSRASSRQQAGSRQAAGRQQQARRFEAGSRHPGDDTGRQCVIRQGVAFTPAPENQTYWFPPTETKHLPLPSTQTTKWRLICVSSYTNSYSYCHSSTISHLNTDSQRSDAFVPSSTLSDYDNRNTFIKRKRREKGEAT